MNPITLLGDMQVFDRIRAEVADLTTTIAVYLAVTGLVASGTAVVLLAVGLDSGPLAAVVSLAFIAAVTEWRGRIALRGHLTVSISMFPAVFAAALFGPLAGMCVFSASALGCNVPIAGRLAYIFNRAIIGALAGGAAAGVMALFPTGPGEVVAAATIAALVAEVADAGFTSLTYTLRGHGRWTDAARDLVPVIVSSVPFYSPVVAVLVLAYKDVSPWTLPLFFVPALAAQRWSLLYQEERRLASDLSDANAQLQAANLSFAKGLIATLDARDQYTAGHSAAVAVYARDIAARMELETDQIELAHLCGLVHDIGKIGYPLAFSKSPARSPSMSDATCSVTPKSENASSRMWIPMRKSRRLYDITTRGLTGRGIRTALM